jgi:hypothetical protein
LNDSTTIKIQFNAELLEDAIQTDELALIESIMSELIREMQQDKIFDEDL